MRTQSDWQNRRRAGRKRENGQTQAEYSVVLAVITVSLVAVLAAFAGGVGAAASRAIGLLPK